MTFQYANVSTKFKEFMKQLRHVGVPDKATIRWLESIGYKSNNDRNNLKVRLTLAKTSCNLSRNTKAALPRLRNVGDMSAHNRRYLAHKRDIDNLIPDLRVVSQELLILSGLK